MRGKGGTIIEEGRGVLGKEEHLMQSRTCVWLFFWKKKESIEGWMSGGGGGTTSLNLPIHVLG